MQRAGEGSAAGSGQFTGRSTSNIWFMVVTLEVSHLERGSLNSVIPKKSPAMSVMAETSQLPMRPHLLVTLIGLALKATTISFRRAVEVKTQGRN